MGFAHKNRFGLDFTIDCVVCCSGLDCFVKIKDARRPKMAEPGRHLSGTEVTCYSSIHRVSLVTLIHYL